MNTPEPFDTLILGAGAAGMMCAAHAGARGGRVLVVDHAKAAGEKIRISGGGRCNFTNLFAGPANFLSNNPHFAKSALKRYTQYDFIDLVARYGIPTHEKTLGQLFCDTSAKDIVAMLLAEMAKVGAELRLNTSLRDITRTDAGFAATLEKDGVSRPVTARALVVACGGKSIPKMGATGFGYQIAEQFGLPLTDIRPALVPLTFGEDMMAGFTPMAGVATDARISCNGNAFDEAILFTHRGLSGPATLQISSFWREKAAITVNLMPHADVFQTLRAKRAENGRRNVGTVLGDLLPKRLAAHVAERAQTRGNIADMSDLALAALAKAITDWTLFPAGTEGYRTAEVTLGGVDTDALNSKTMEAKTVPGLYFIGEVVDVTGWLGGYNFQWAWSSGWAAGTAIAG
ncbi:NAD(P)/FAD-dependent oxidoreductase [Pseudogemmobacter sp. W21_MBD1_M6]|uniref:NAD(P)/FAD-dependent oxidoreductase n=1 Tax=Pseudogemmobacter sp. W21_MBD1_M6 TaxID=3240271 RepID=UPI003F9BDE71